MRVLDELLRGYEESERGVWRVFKSVIWNLDKVGHGQDRIGHRTWHGTGHGQGHRAGQDTGQDMGQDRTRNFSNKFYEFFKKQKIFKNI